MGVVVIDLGPTRLQQFNQLDRGRLPQIVDVLLVRQTQHEDFRAIDGLLGAVQGLGHLAHHVLGHLSVDLAGQLDEPRAHVELTGLPGQVERVDGNAVPAQARTWVERVESERFGAGGGDDLPHVDAHVVQQNLHLIDQGDVDAAIDVLEDFRRLRRFATADRNHGIDGPAV